MRKERKEIKRNISQKNMGGKKKIKKQKNDIMYEETI